ncbi:hypothetical protein JTE90_007736 [Oedothorax gibbosus]|uniref:Uncharacterized protein n=1 Tax=Oedothorax gibbosus TaxID=931172 RepID=A0AAV6V5D7_9ARAC|nr:hypothetical protein JTE90_007736 [Oedothorax gibbosus]
MIFFIAKHAKFSSLTRIGIGIRVHRGKSQERWRQGGIQCSHPTRQDESGSANQAKKGREKRGKSGICGCPAGKMLSMETCEENARSLRKRAFFLVFYSSVDPETGECVALFPDGNEWWQ